MDRKRQLELQQARAQQNAGQPFRPAAPPASMKRPPAMGVAALDTANSAFEGGLKSFGDVYRGVKKGLTYADEWMNDGSGAEAMADREQLAKDQLAAEQRFQPFENANPIASNLLPFVASALPPVRSVKGAMALGGAMGAIPYSDNQLLSGALGGAMGGAGQWAGNKLGKFMAEGADLAPGAQKLLDQNIPLTAGQRMGGATKFMEDKMSGTPFIGDQIQARRQEAIKAYAPSVTRQAIRDSSPIIAEALDQAQRTAGGLSRGNQMAEANKMLSDSYNDVLDFDFNLEAPAIDALKNKYTNHPDLSEAGIKRVNRLVDDIFTNKLKPGTVSGRTLKTVDSELGTVSKKFGDSQSAFEKETGGVIKDLKRDTMQLIESSHPDKYAQIRKLDESFSKLRDLDKAAGAVGAEDGMFTPAQHKRSLLQGMGKRKAAERNDPRLMDAEEAQAIMASTIGSSGTSERQQATEAALKAGGGIAGAITGGAMFPQETMIAGALGSVPYLGGTRTGQKAVNSFLFDRPDTAPIRALKAMQERGIPAQAGRSAGILASQPSTEEQIEDLKRKLGLLN